MSAKPPWMKFYPADWRADPALRICSLAARGLWIEMLAIMHEASPRGHLLVQGKQVTDDQLAAAVGSTRREVSKALAELEAAKVFSRKKNGVIFSRRMVRDENLARISRENGRKGGNPSLCKHEEIRGPDNPPLKAKSLESESEREKEPPTGGSKKSRGERLPDGFAPDLAMAVAEGLSEPESRREALKFRDYWTGRSGQGATKLDWPATWRNWVRKAVDDRRRRLPASSAGPPPRRSGMGGYTRSLLSEGMGDEDDFRGTTIEGTVGDRDRGGLARPVLFDALGADR